MNYISKNLKTVGMVNIALTVIAMMLEIFSLFDATTTKVDMIFNIAILLSLTAGLYYSLCLYKKSAANYYKFFIIVYLLTILDGIIVHTINVLVNLTASFDFVYALCIVSAILVCVLAFAKNLGKKKSYILVLANLVLNVILVICQLLNLSNAQQLPATLWGMFILSWLCVVFVAGKYADKDSRGAK